MQGLVARQQKNWPEAERRYEEALMAYRDLGLDEANVFNNLGGVARSQSQSDRAKKYYQHALEIAKKTGYVEVQAACCTSLGFIALDGDHLIARPLFERGLTLAKKIGKDDQVATAQSGLARVLEQEQRYHEALALAQQALQTRERLRHQDLPFSRRLVERLQKKLPK
jgi:tetratricopeptide (TPR) repeat protein